MDLRCFIDLSQVFTTVFLFFVKDLNNVKKVPSFPCDRAKHDSIQYPLLPGWLYLNLQLLPRSGPVWLLPNHYTEILARLQFLDNLYYELWPKWWSGWRMRSKIPFLYKFWWGSQLMLQRGIIVCLLSAKSWQTNFPHHTVGTTQRLPGPLGSE